VAGDDKKSVRAFERLVDGRKLEFFSKQGSTSFLLVDAETGSGWDFTGKAISGPLSGKQLKKVPLLTIIGLTGRPTIHRPRSISSVIANVLPYRNFFRARSCDSWIEPLPTAIHPLNHTKNHEKQDRFLSFTELASLLAC